MPRKPSSKGASNSPSPSSSMGPTKINVYDQNAVKQLLDDVIIQHVIDGRGLKEDLTLSNYKLALGAFSCLIALASHFAPFSFPENMWFLKVCVVLYFLISTILSYLSYSVEGCTILTTKDTLIEDERKKSRFMRAMAIETLLPRCDENFAIHVRTRRGKPVARTMTSSIGRWFQEDGTFLADTFEQDIDHLFRSIEDEVD